jgi:hypothetical protein
MARTLDPAGERFLLRAVAHKYGVTTKDIVGDDRWQYLDYPRMEVIHQLRQMHGYTCNEVATLIGRTSRGVQFVSARQQAEKPKRQPPFTYPQLVVNDPFLRVRDVGVPPVMWSQLTRMTHWSYAYWIFVGETTIDDIRATFHWKRAGGVRAKRMYRPARV